MKTATATMNPEIAAYVQSLEFAPLAARYAADDYYWMTGQSEHMPLAFNYSLPSRLATEIEKKVYALMTDEERNRGY